MDHGIANGLLYNRSRVSLDDVPDGASTTVIVGEVLFSWEDDIDRWYIGSNDVDNGVDLSEFLASMSKRLNQRSELSFGSNHSSETVNFGFADGHIQTIDRDIDPTVQRALGSRNGQEKIPEDAF